MRSRYLDPIRIFISVGRRAEWLQAKRSKNKRDANVKAFLESADFLLKVNVGCGNERSRAG